MSGGLSNQSDPLTPGTYSVEEVSLPVGWSLTSATCDGGNQPGAISLATGDTVTCTFVNTEDQGSPEADLAIEIFQNGAFASGTTGSYNLLTRNESTAAGSAVSPISVVVDLPDELTFNSFSDPFSDDWSCNSDDGQRINCAYSGAAISPGGFLPTLEITVNVNPVAAAPPGSTCATVAHAGDNNSANNQSCVVTALQ